MVHSKVPLTLSDWVKNKIGFEIRAPSVWTRGNFSIYVSAATIDVTSFANMVHLSYENNKQSIDFVCVADVLEHIVNPFKALLELYDQVVY